MFTAGMIRVCRRFRVCAAADIHRNLSALFADRIGVSKSESTIDAAFLEDCLRDDLNKRARRVMAVLHPLKLVIENYPDGVVEELDAVNNPEDSTDGFAEGSLLQCSIHRTG